MFTVCTSPTLAMQQSHLAMIRPERGAPAGVLGFPGHQLGDMAQTVV
jgi:hypothetical protein